ncbi:MAG: PEP-CTERM sorting domain-containing protein, partial [Verrucomicrobiota bacterium]
RTGFCSLEGHQPICSTSKGVRSTNSNGVDLWSIAASIDNTGDAAAAFNINYTASAGVDLDTDSDGGGIAGGFQAMPSLGGSGGVATPPFTTFSMSDFSQTVTPIPEPSTFALLGLGVVGLTILRRRK